MADIHTYFVVERKNIGSGNWAALVALFEAMGMQYSKFPCFNNHDRTRLDGDAVIYESKFDTEEVSIAAFKQLLADEFGVDVADIGDVQDTADYAGIGTTTWVFTYGGVDRFLIERFGGGEASWMQSGDEARGYLKLNSVEWEPEEV
ncbi:unnamed protein product [marine sediment metagenome]|uniref:Uncharacterized protein n=1 Tax=marine sediment metagenome TaxID=412755 RepID=X0SNE8_9ZZZZ